MALRKCVSALFSVLACTLSADTVFVREKAGFCWQDGLFIGDGATGALAYAPAGLEWTVNRNDVLDSRVAACDYIPHDKVMETLAATKSRSAGFLRAERKRVRQPADMGDTLTKTISAAVLRARFWAGTGWCMPSLPAARQELDTRTGELAETMASPFADHRAVSFVERSRDVMVIEIGGAWLELIRPEDVRLERFPCVWSNANGVVSFTQQLPGGETYAVALTAPGGVRTGLTTASVRVASQQAVYLAVRTTRDAADARAAAIAAVKAAEKDGIDRIRADHREWWRSFWTKGARVRFDSEPTIDTQWNFALYALASQYGRPPMPTLNGLVYGPLGGLDGGVGSNCYVHDQNVQIPMMPFFPLGHVDFIETYVKTYENALPEIRRRTREQFGVDGAYLPLNMNPYGFEHPIGDYRYTLCGAAYSGLVLAQAWWYTQDERILRRIYPLLKEFIAFYTSTAKRDAAGTYRFIWSVPPEIFSGSHDDLTTIACLKPCLEVAVEAATRFCVDAEACALWKDILAHYPAFGRHSEGGWWCGPEIPDDHYMYGGHLFYPFFPAESDTDVETAGKTLDYTWKYGVDVAYTTETPHPVHDWSALYTGMATTRIHGGARGWKALTDFYDGYAKPNGLFSHNPVLLTRLTPAEIKANLERAPKVERRNGSGRTSPVSRRGPNDLTYNPDAKALVAPVIEGGASFLLLASETLCQSWGGEIKLFPSVPPHFTGSFENFRVRGGYLVSAAMKDGKVVGVTVNGVPEDVKVRVVAPTDPAFKYLPPRVMFGNAGGKDILVDGKAVQIRAGELEPQRIPRPYWRHRIRMCKAMGLNAISSYFMWNGFERPDGTFDFTTGNRDVAAFLKICQEEGMWVLFRPGPFVCAEWDFGGLPSRLLKGDMKIRSTDPRYLAESEKYLAAIAAVAEPFLAKHGGPILLTQIENEYGSWPFKDPPYLTWLKAFLKSRGFGPFYMADGAGDRFLKDLIYPDPEIAVGFDPAKSVEAWAFAEKYNPGVPVLSAETYPGWLRHWGEGDWKQTDLRKTLKWFMDGKRSFCLFVAHGGTSFGFTAGANGGGPGGYKADLTSYDYAAPIDEQGRATPAYHDYRRILAEATGERLPDVPEPMPATSFASVVPQRIANLRTAGGCVRTESEPLFFEAVDQDQGLGVYSTDVPAGVSGELVFTRMADYAQVYLDGRRLATVDRRLKREPVVIPPHAKPAILEIVVEAMGHVNFHKEMCDDRKGLIGPVRIGDKTLGSWKMSFDPLDEASVTSVRATVDDGLPGGRFRGTFALAEVADTNIDLSKWTKGTVYVNGHNLGRYWKIGPQYSLYCPAEFLKVGENVFDIVEMEQREPQPVRGVTHPVRPTKPGDTVNADNVW